MNGPVLNLAVKCHYCSKFRAPDQIIELGTGGAKICWHCWEWHNEALSVLAGSPPQGCQECGVTFAELRLVSGDGDVRMYLHAKDGVYQILCPACSDRYVPKRRDLYGPTLFGHRMNLN